MARYLAGRLVSGLVVLLLFVTFIFFFSQTFVKGDFVQANFYLSPAEMREQIRVELGLDQPLGVRYVDWLSRLIRLDFGESFYGFPVLPAVFTAIKRSLLVMVPGMVLAFLIGEYLGRVSAWRGPGFLTDSATFLAIVFYSFFPPAMVFMLKLILEEQLGLVSADASRILNRMERSFPDFSVDLVYDRLLWTILGAVAAAFILNRVVRRLTRRPIPLLALIALIFGLWAASWYAFGFWEPALLIGQFALIPVFTFTLLSMGDMLVVARASVTDTLYDEYVFTARAKGLSEKVVRDRHAARNALLPIVSKAVISLPFLLTGLVIIEAAMNWPGIGSLLYESIRMRDVPTSMGALIVVGVFSLLVRLLLDVLLFHLDPRLRASGNNL